MGLFAQCRNHPVFGGMERHRFASERPGRSDLNFFGARKYWGVFAGRIGGFGRFEHVERNARTAHDESPEGRHRFARGRNDRLLFGLFPKGLQAPRERKLEFESDTGNGAHQHESGRRGVLGRRGLRR